MNPSIMDSLDLSKSLDMPITFLENTTQKIDSFELILFSFNRLQSKSVIVINKKAFYSNKFEMMNVTKISN